MHWEMKTDIYTLPRVKQLVGSCCIEQAVSSVLSDDLGGRVEGAGGRSKREEIYVHRQLIHFIVLQKLTQQCQTIILHKTKQNKTNGSSSVLKN